MVELHNGITLDKALASTEQGFAMDKDIAASIFASGSRTRIVHCRCIVPDCKCPGTVGRGTAFSVSRKKGSIKIGCITFTPPDVETVRKWADA